MIAFADMPDRLELTMTTEDLTGCVPKQPFSCPIARKVWREVGRHDGVTRQPGNINGIPYRPDAAAIAFMDVFDAYGHRSTDHVTFPYTVGFTRVTPRVVRQKELPL